MPPASSVAPAATVDSTTPRSFCSWAWSMIGPSAFAGAVGSPTRRCAAFSAGFATFSASLSFGNEVATGGHANLALLLEGTHVPEEAAASMSASGAPDSGTSHRGEAFGIGLEQRSSARHHRGSVGVGQSHPAGVRRPRCRDGSIGVVDVGSADRGDRLSRRGGQDLGGAGTAGHERATEDAAVLGVAHRISFEGWGGSGARVPSRSGTSSRRSRSSYVVPKVSRTMASPPTRSKTARSL